MATALRLTIDEFLAREDGDWRWEQLVDGEIVVNAPTWPHQNLVGELYFELTSYARAAPRRGIASLGVDVRLDEHNLYVPDVLWWTEADRPGEGRPHHAGPPSLAVEVRSPSTWRYDVGTKQRMYEQHGLPELWLVDGIADTVIVRRRSSPEAERFDVALELGRGEVLGSPSLPGFSLELDVLFDAP